MSETVLWRGRPSLWNSWRSLTAGAACAAAGFAAVWLDQEWAAPALGAAAGLLLTFATLGYGRRLYTVTNQRVIARQGLLDKHETEVEIRDIRHLNLQQSFLQRMFGIGDVEVSSAGGLEIEVRLQGIPGPERVKETIRQARLAGPKGAD